MLTVRLRGRVLARPADAEALVALDPGWVVTVVGEAVAVLEPGDLASIEALVYPPDEVHVAVAVERLFRPISAPGAVGPETDRLIRGGVYPSLLARARLLAAVRAYFASQGFLEVETPAVVVSPGLDVHLAAFAVSAPGAAPSVDPRGYLITSPEYHMKRLLVGGIPRCFQVARCFRAGELGRRHQPEFTMLEWYRAWATLDDVLADTEAIVRAVAKVSAAPFERLTVREAFQRWAPQVGDPVALAERDEHGYFDVFTDAIEPNLGRGTPTFLTRFPARHASLARLAADDPTVCERAELYVAGVELCNAFLELTDPAEQRARFERDVAERVARGLPVYPVDAEFLAALEEGLPPSAGNALGLDRLIALAAGRDDIADVMAFPHASR